MTIFPIHSLVRSLNNDFVFLWAVSAFLLTIVGNAATVPTQASEVIRQFRIGKNGNLDLEGTHDSYEFHRVMEKFI